MSTIGIDIRNIGKHRTGDEVVFFNLVKSLAGIDKKNKYLLFTDIMDQQKLAEIKNNLNISDNPSFEIISLLCANKFVWNFWTLHRFIRKNPLDIYLTQYIVPFFVPKQTRIITIIHDISFKVYGQFIKRSDLFFLGALIPCSLKRADKIVAVSRFTREEILKYYKIAPEKVVWIHNAVSDDFWASDTTSEKIEAVRRKYNLPEKYLLYLGTLQPRKNIPTLIKAFSKIGDHIKLVIAGGKSHNFDLQIDEAVKKYNLQDKIIFPGFIDEEDKAAVIKAADLFCFPSFYEGFGIPILEAMSVGTPVIASNILPHKEIASDAALFFDPNDFQELADKLLYLINNEEARQDLIRKGSEQVKNFSWKNTAEKMMGIFEGMK